ncbi:hypothetical protein UFOVP1290_232 [uncultured Caudovirales phage]|uniref:Uncharacterized protein n=1 Tax=uncultured Caudovirales phage TaxID=2100421 RepID=A0A6J5RKW5_9CAUD|nr:hypothetical protein UFOVP1290_232 [uncultured Caudovirales phage]
MNLNDFLEEAVRNIIVAAATKSSNLNIIQRVMPLLKDGDHWNTGHVLNSSYKVIINANGQQEYRPMTSSKYKTYLVTIN